MNDGIEHRQWNCRIDPSGRLVLPQPVRLQQGLEDGDELVVSIEGGAIVLRNYVEAMQRLQDAFCAGASGDASLCDELIAERRQEARREESR